MSEQENKSGWRHALQNPATYYMLVAISVMWVFVYLFRDSSNQQNASTQEEVKHLRIENNQLRREKDDLTMALLVKNGIINEIKKTTDSVARESFGNAAKKVLEK